MLNALRLSEGFETRALRRAHRAAARRDRAPLAEAERSGLIERDLQRVRPTPRGFDFLNDLQALFLPPR